MVNVGDTVRVVRSPYEEGTFDKDTTYKVVEYTGGLFNLEGKGAYPLYEEEIEVVFEPEVKFYAGRKVRIVADSVTHGFVPGEEVYILGKDHARASSWLASKNRDAEPRWTGRDFMNDDSSVVMNVTESDMEPIEEPMADWERELLTPGSTDLSTEQEQVSLWLEVVEGTVATIKYLPTNETFTTTVHVDDYGSLEVLGWSFDQGEDPQFEDIELLSVEQPEKPKPVLKVGSSVWDAPNNLVVFLTDNGWVDQEGDQRAVDFSTMAGTGDFRVLYDAGSDD